MSSRCNSSSGAEDSITGFAFGFHSERNPSPIATNTNPIAAIVNGNRHSSVETKGAGSSSAPGRGADCEESHIPASCANRYPTTASIPAAIPPWTNIVFVVDIVSLLTGFHTRSRVT